MQDSTRDTKLLTLTRFPTKMKTGRRSKTCDKILRTVWQTQHGGIAGRCYTAYRIEALLDANYQEVYEALSLLAIPFTYAYVQSSLNVECKNTVWQAVQRLQDHDLLECGLLKLFPRPHTTNKQIFYARTYHLKGRRDFDFLMLHTAQSYRMMRMFECVDWIPPLNLPNPLDFPRPDPAQEYRRQSIIDGFDPGDMTSFFDDCKALGVPCPSYIPLL